MLALQIITIVFLILSYIIMTSIMIIFERDKPRNLIIWSIVFLFTSVVGYCIYIFSNDLKEIGYFSSMDGVQSEAAIVNAGTVGYDMAAMFTTGKDNRSLISDAWRPFMQSKTCLTNYNF